MSPDRITLEGPEPIELVLRRSPRARRFSLRVSRLDGGVTLTLPARADAAEGIAFARSRRDWIVQARARVGQVARPVFGAQVPFEGVPHRLVPARLRAPRREMQADGPVILMPEDPARLARRLEAFYRVEARSRLAEASGRHAVALGRSFTRLSLRDTRSRWGSCTADGGLMYSWRLVMAPPEVLDYVAAHEVAHLCEMNHSPAFWAVVARLCPGYAAPRDWLRRNGGTLHALRLRD
ncbi:M48 family metallopeptidase [Phaeovulum vinaykumarii]|uniref:YgjP-like metallopeptidase domain-containing protein n=1 Tax=Phaeovulum vinaykumarii TaxID=407234 RepID=A0A1N7KE73_9RHOB|nr:SprT family zinc-dependent metalloprotease [Phaeovulum vinaykumarii]SIS59819.1 hypothetical protein SAMN05421795_101863 [Phaeovulum vinaykumarii]SOB94241.1 hypothetical protein SAMN05878426_101859 [Phaeovulum vinaykumarii]